MFTTLTRWADSRAQFIVFLVLSYLHFALDHWWEGSAFANVVKYAFLSYMPLWLSVKAWVGYQRRKPYWTRESWLRYLRLAVMPVVVLALVLWISSFDMALTWSVLGAPGSPTRGVWAVILLGLMLLGVIGLLRAVDWLVKGEPSEQFMRTRWIQRRGSDLAQT